MKINMCVFRLLLVFLLLFHAFSLCFVSLMHFNDDNYKKKKRGKQKKIENKNNEKQKTTQKKSERKTRTHKQTADK